MCQRLLVMRNVQPRFPQRWAELWRPMGADQGRLRGDGWMQPPIADNKMNLDPSGLMKVPLQNHILSPLTHSLFLWRISSPRKSEMEFYPRFKESDQQKGIIGTRMRKMNTKKLQYFALIVLCREYNLNGNLSLN